MLEQKTVEYLPTDNTTVLLTILASGSISTDNNTADKQPHRSINRKRLRRKELQLISLLKANV